MNIFYKPIDVNASRVSLDEAKMYLLFLNHKGMKGWRLPTPEEVFEIYEHRKTQRVKYSNYHLAFVWNTTDLLTDNYHKHQARVLAVRSKNEKNKI